MKAIRTPLPGRNRREVCAPSLRGSIIMTKGTLRAKERVLPNKKRGIVNDATRRILESVGQCVEIAIGIIVRGISVISHKITGNE
jgi:hypothetical protein